MSALVADFIAQASRCSTCAELELVCATAERVLSSAELELLHRAARVRLDLLAAKTRVELYALDSLARSIADSFARGGRHGHGVA